MTAPMPMMSAGSRIDARLAERDRLQPGGFVAAARAAEADRHVAAVEPAATLDEDGWPAREARAVLLAVAGSCGRGSGNENGNSRSTESNPASKDRSGRMR
jgi:hypothetical protein